MTKINPKPIKVCFIAPKAYPIFNTKEGTYFGGAEVDLYYLATELAKDSGFDVSFITADYGQPDEEIFKNIKVIKSLNFKSNPLTGAIKVWKALKKCDAEIYMFKTAHPGAMLTALFCKLKKRAFVYRTAGKPECSGQYIRENFFSGKAFYWALKNAKLVFVQNEHDKAEIKKSSGIESIAIPNGHPIQSVTQTEKDTILWVGRDVPVKRPEIFLELARKTPCENFTMICQTYKNDQAYADMIKNANELKNMQFIQHVPFDQIQDYYKRAKVFVNTSDAEGFPNTFIQTCMAAAPILSLNVNPDNFLYEYNCGLCCNGDFNKLTSSLADMLKDNKYKRMGKNARKYVEQKHDISNIIEQYKNLFIEISK